MKVAALKRLNGLKDSRLKPGQILLVASKGTKERANDQHDSDNDSDEVIAQLAAPNANELSEDALAEVGIEPIARSYLSIPYRYGAQSRKSTDCSGFVQQVFREFDIRLPRTAREQFTVGAKIERSSLASGDLLFFRTRARKKYPTHVGIYLGNGKMIHASSRQHKVVISDVNHPYYVKRYVGAKRAATFLPGEIDLEMLARQVTGLTHDMPLSEAIATDIQESVEAPPVIEASLHPATPEVVMEAGYDDRQDRADELDDIDGEVEPDPELIIPVAPPTMGEQQPELAENPLIVAGALAPSMEEQSTTSVQPVVPEAAR